jgi:hypothetical protein
MQTVPSPAESDLPAKSPPESPAESPVEPELAAANSLSVADEGVSSRHKTFLEAVYHWVLSRS